MVFFEEIELTLEEQCLIGYLNSIKSNKQIIQKSFKSKDDEIKQYKKLFRKPEYKKLLENIRRDLKKNKNKVLI